METRVTRRRMLLMSVQFAGAGVFAGLLGACGQQASTPAAKPTEAAKPAAPAAATAPSTAATTAPAAKPADAAKPAAAAPAQAAPASKPAGGSGGALKVAHFANPSQLDPIRSVAGFDKHVSLAIFDPLVGMDKSLKLQPALAESWDSPDLTNWTFKLRKGVKFHDGTDFNAQAVKFHIERMKDPATKSSLAGQVAIIDHVEVVDDYTAKMVTKSPYANLPALMADRHGYINSPAAIQTAGADYGVTSAVGTGPFKFVEWRQNDKITLEKNTSYWDPARPKVDRIDMAIIPDDNVRLANVKTGQLDAVYSLAFKDIQPLRSDKSLQLIEAPGIATWNVFIHAQNPPFNNLALRQAWAYTIDREAILQAAAFGSGAVSNTVFAPGFGDYYLKDLKPLPRDLDMAKKKLAEGGQPNGFEFEFIAISVGPFQTIAQILQAQAAEVGIKANINVMDDAAWSVRNNTTCDVMAGQSIWTGRPDLDSTLAAMYDPDGSSCKGGRYNVPEATDLIRKARETKEVADRQKIYAQIGKLTVDNVMDLQLVYPSTSVLLTPKVGGFQVYGDGFVRWDEVTIQS
jgi:peptide/nickel transport system substrate-binding protein